MLDFHFDHLVWFMNKPEEAIFPLKELGLYAANGGRHETWGTYNTLAYFGLSYIEFLGIESVAIAKNQEENRLVAEIVRKLAGEKQEGPAKIAIRTNQIGELAVKLKGLGYQVFGPLPGERVRGDGQTIRWSLLFPEHKEKDGLSLPFFIQWERSDEERLEELQEQGWMSSHTVKNLKFDSVGFVVRDLEATAVEWGKLVDLTPSGEFIDKTLNARCRTLELQGTKLMFCTPAGEGLAARILNEKGETPFLVNLNITNQVVIKGVLNGYWNSQK